MGGGAGEHLAAEGGASRGPCFIAKLECSRGGATSGGQAPSAAGGCCTEKSARDGGRDKGCGEVRPLGGSVRRSLPGAQLIGLAPRSGLASTDYKRQSVESKRRQASILSSAP